MWWLPYAGWWCVVCILSRIVRAAGATARSHWFWLHAAGNAVVCALTCTSFYRIWSEPEHAIFTAAPPAGGPIHDGIVIAILHTYHVVCFRDVPWDDIVHHVLFVPYSHLALLAPALGAWPWGWGPGVQMQHFFICGLPGLVDYACLALRRDHHMSKATQKRIQVKLNVWLRVPGVLFSCSLLLFETMRHWRACPAAARGGVWLVVLSNCALIRGNALYYAEKVVRAFPPQHARPPNE